MASASSSIFWVALVCTMSPSAARTLVVRVNNVLFLRDPIELHNHFALLRIGRPFSARWTMRRLGTCGAFRIVERALRISPRVRTLMMKSPRRTRATATSTSVVPV